VSIPSVDIVLDVARAADPERYREAVQRLTELRSAAAETPAASIPAASTTDQRPATFARTIEANPVRQEPARPRTRLNAYGQFEAFLLQTFVQSMLPKNAANVYGKGTAGEVWRSMLAERIGEQLAKSGQVGIADRLASSVRQPAPGMEAASGLPAPAAEPRPQVSAEAAAAATTWAASIQPSTDGS
jgi:flagellar protein FlgJ